MSSELNVNGRWPFDITDHISAVLAYWDKDLVCRYANAAYVEWFGRTQEEMVNKVTLAELLGPEIYMLNLPYIKGALAGNPQSFEREIITPTGEVRYSLANYFPRIENGHVAGFIAHVTDVTQLKELKKELASSAETIQEQNKVLLDYTNIISHNLKAYANNLAVILDLFKVQRSEADRNELLEFMKEISGGLKETVNNLSQLSEAPRSRELKFEQVNLDQYIQRTVHTLGNDIISCGATIHNNVRPDTRLPAIPAYIGSIILNLLTNAINFRQPDKPLIVEMDAFYVKNELIFFIKDNGRGIDLALHKNDLFGIYKTFHCTSGKGTGLFLVKQKAEAMGARIEVESEVNIGTVFKIHFRIPEFKVG